MVGAIGLAGEAVLSFVSGDFASANALANQANLN